MRVMLYEAAQSKPPGALNEMVLAEGLVMVQIARRRGMKKASSRWRVAGPSS